MIIYSGNHSLAKNVFKDTGIEGAIGLLTSYPNKPSVSINYPFSIENKRYPTWNNNQKWDKNAYIKILNHVRDNNLKPQWILCPDIPYNAKATRMEWDIWYEFLRGYNFPIAYAVQNGMKPKDVPPEADVVFIGGDTEWKHSNIRVFSDEFKRVHVGRINSLKWLWECHYANCESVDGNGWFRTKPGSSTKGRSCYGDLIEYLKITNGLPVAS